MEGGQCVLIRGWLGKTRFSTYESCYCGMESKPCDSSPGPHNYILTHCNEGLIWTYKSVAILGAKQGQWVTANFFLLLSDRIFQYIYDLHVRPHRFPKHWSWGVVSCLIFHLIPIMVMLLLKFRLIPWIALSYGLVYHVWDGCKLFPWWARMKEAFKHSLRTSKLWILLGNWWHGTYKSRENEFHVCLPKLKKESNKNLFPRRLPPSMRK